MFHTSCVFYFLVFYNPTILIIPLAHLGDNHTRRRIYMYRFRPHLLPYVCPYEFNNGLVVIGLGLRVQLAVVRISLSELITI